MLEFRVLDAELNPTNISNTVSNKKQTTNMMMIRIFSSKNIVAALAMTMTMTMTINNNNNNNNNKSIGSVFVYGESIADKLSNAKDTAANAFNSTNEALMNATDNLVDALNTIGDEDDADDASSASASSMFFLTAMPLSMMSMSMIGIVVL